MRIIFSLLVGSLSLGLALAGAPPELPSTPAGKVLAGYLEALNSGNKDKLEVFIKAHRPDLPSALDRMLDLRWNTGGLDLHSIESSQALNIQAVLHEREGNGTYNRMSVTVSDGDPAVITNIKDCCIKNGMMFLEVSDATSRIGGLAGRSTASSAGTLGRRVVAQ